MGEWVAPRGQRRAHRGVLALGLLALVAWQFSFSSFGGTGATDPAYRIWAATGLHDNAKFVFFLRHLNLYPLATRAPIPADTRAAAEEILRTRPESLVMDEHWTFRAGDRGRTLLFLLDAWLRDRSDKLSVRPATALAWIGSLSALLWMFWRAGAPLLGVCLVLLLGSNATATHEIYSAETRYGGANIFGWAFVALAALLALHADLLLGAGRRLGAWVALLPVVAGVFLASVRTIRSEPAPLLASCALLYLMQRWLSWPKRLGLVALLSASFLLATAGWDRYFETKFNEVVATLQRVGGTPYPGPYRRYHEFWHPVWCGLGDFDRTHGYAWDDRKAYAYAIPIMRDTYGVAVPSDDVSGSFIPGASWDGGGIYPIVFSELPHYDDIVRDKVLGDIRAEPGWYLSILAQRTRRILFDNAPVQVAWGAHRARLPVAAGGWLLLGALLLCAVRRDATGLALLVFTLPLWATPLFVYSDRGVAYYASGSQSVAAALLLALAATALARRRQVDAPASPIDPRRAAA